MISFVITYITIGFLSGILIGLLGIGAGVIMIPLLIHSGLTIQQAVAIGMVLQAVPQSLPGVYLHYKNKSLLVKESIYVVIGSLLGTIIGTYILIKKIIPDRYLYALLSIFLIIIAIYLLYKYVLFL